jgi:hypothetical protein
MKTTYSTTATGKRACLPPVVRPTARQMLPLQEIHLTTVVHVAGLISVKLTHVAVQVELTVSPNPHPVS